MTFWKTHGVKTMPTGRATPWPNRAETTVRLFKRQYEKLLMDASVNPALSWATPPVRLELSGKIPERPRKRSQSVSWTSPREYGWDAPSPIIQAFGASRAFPEFSPSQYGWGRLFFQKWFRMASQSRSWNSQQPDE